MITMDEVILVMAVDSFAWLVLNPDTCKFLSIASHWPPWFMVCIFLGIVAYITAQTSDCRMMSITRLGRWRYVMRALSGATLWGVMITMHQWVFVWAKATDPEMMFSGFIATVWLLHALILCVCVSVIKLTEGRKAGAVVAMAMWVTWHYAAYIQIYGGL